MKEGKEEHQMNDGKKTSKTAHHRMMIRDFRRRFIISIIITIPILLFSPFIQSLTGLTILFPGISYVSFGLSSVIFFYGGRPFLSGLIDEVRERSLGMMTLIAVAISVAYFYSTAVTFGLEGDIFFWELATLIDIMLLGHWIEMRSILGASRALEKLVELMPSEAHLIQDGEVNDVDLQELKKEDKILIKPGEKIPADGIILEGKSYIDESMLTGESIPVKREEDQEVIGGSINGDSSLKVRVKSTGEDSYLSRVINMVREAQASKSKNQRLADRAAFWLTIIALSVGFTTLISWSLLGESFNFAIERMATVMVITCPHALGLAIPLVVAVSTTLSAKNGLLIRNRSAFEASRKISTVIFDKTGTLTEGKFAVNKIQSLKTEYDEDEILKIAASLEQKSEHPIAQGIIRKAKEKNIPIPEAKNFNIMKGKGVEATLNGDKYGIYSPNYLEKIDLEEPKNLKTGPIDTVVFLVQERQDLIAAVTLSDKIRDESYEAIDTLKKMGIKCWMLTGDNEKVAKTVSEELKLDGYFAELLPDEKLEKIKEIQKRGEFVAMTGDGINDAPALAQADVGIAIGSGTDIAAETADIILVESSPKDVSSLIKFGEATYNKIIQNLFWATGYNVFAIPLAAGVLINLGIVISPAIGALLMSLSTVIVAINAKLLKVE
ncbi:MAG: copper-translocating P-type ATPase [Promethearchaeia archaeon]